MKVENGHRGKQMKQFQKESSKGTTSQRGLSQMRTVLVVSLVCIGAALNAILIASQYDYNILQEMRLSENPFEQAKLQCDNGTEHTMSVDQLDSIPLSDGGTLFWGEEHIATNKGQHLLFPMSKILDTPVIAQALDDEIIDLDYERERCARYGFDIGNRTSRRRVFFGSIIADEPFRVLQTVSTEVYNIFDTVAFIESNRSVSIAPRELRWPPGSERLEALRAAFGPKTRVTVDYYVDGPILEQAGYHREHRQRQNVLERWHRNGMQPDDIGVFGDADEMFFRDFLRALQICNVPEFTKNQDCKEPKIQAKALLFESSPECVYQDRFWWHPDAIVGECLEKIGDETVHPPPHREYKDIHSFRANGHGRDRNYSTYFEANPKAGTMYPLWNPADLRRITGGRMVERNQTLYTGFHLRNNFLTSRDIRNKYTKNAENSERFNTVPLTLINQDVGVAVSCAHSRTVTGKGRALVKGGFSSLQGPRPLLYENDEFRSLRHQELVKLVLEDARRYGVAMNASCDGFKCDACNSTTCDGYGHRDTRVFQILKDIGNVDDAQYLREYLDENARTRSERSASNIA